jgi:hypothetical protein
MWRPEIGYFSLEKLLIRNHLSTGDKSYKPCKGNFFDKTEGRVSSCGIAHARFLLLPTYP